MKQCYVTARDWKPRTVALIETMNRIVREYQQQGFVLTVRQLYYQLVARDVIANTLQEYKRVASIINDAKLAGLMDWDAIEDRTREFVRETRWRSGAHILKAAADGFHMDMWVGQPRRVFVIVEKEALVGVLDGVCREFDVPLLAARGYPSGSVLRSFAQEDVIKALADKQHVLILHLGDHDPSGIDMTRDLRMRMELFAETYNWDVSLDLRRIALTRGQIDELRPPENPAKTTDSRFNAYMAEHGASSWELDALSPTYLADLIREHIQPEIDADAWALREQMVSETQVGIRRAASQFELRK